MFYWKILLPMKEKLKLTCRWLIKPQIRWKNMETAQNNIRNLYNLTLFLPPMGGISPYMSITWPSPVGIGLNPPRSSQGQWGQWVKNWKFWPDFFLLHPLIFFITHLCFSVASAVAIYLLEMSLRDNYWFVNKVEKWEK